MDWTNKNVNQSKVVRIGDEIEVMVLDIDEERRRISLGVKQCKSNPWNDFAASFNKGDRVSARSSPSPTSASSSVWPAGGIDRTGAPVRHLLGRSRRRGRPQLQEGRGPRSRGARHRSGRKRISLGIKQLDQDPFSKFLADHPKGSIIRGIISEVDARGGIVDLEGGIKGQLRASELSRDRVEDARTVLKVGEEVEAKFTGLDRKNRVVSLSIKAKEAHDEAQAVESYRAESGSSATTLGELLKERISNAGES